MGNMISYIIEYGHLGFDELAFSEVDSLILAQISYLVVDGYVSPRHSFRTTVRDIADTGDENITKKTTLPKENKLFLSALQKSKRFGDIKVACYTSVTDTETEIQFAALALRLAPDLHYISFRGTDTTLVGWKEDFNLAYSDNIPSQAMAVNYLKQTARFMRGKLILGGHSKGGHLAVYAAMHTTDSIKKRINAIYNHDGPGFPHAIFDSEEYKSIQDRIYKTVPHSAIVGMMLENHGPYTVVASRYFPILQHNPFTWEIRDTDFVRLKKVDFLSDLTNRTLSKWMEETTPEMRKQLFDALFDILQSTGAETYPELIEALKKDFSPMLEKLISLDAQTRKMLLKVLHSLLKTATLQLKLMVKKDKKE